MIKILSLKSITNNPSDGISNFLKATFGKLTEGANVYAKHIGVSPSGLLKDAVGASLLFMWHKRPNILFGTGHPREIIYVLLKPPGTKYVINFHSVLYRGEDSPWAVRTPWWLRSFIFKQASLVICPSEFSANSVRHLLPSLRVVSILNGVDLDLFNPARANRQELERMYSIPNDEKPLISFVGSLHHRKRPEVVAAVALQVPQARFVMVGREVGEYDPSALRKIPNVIWIPRMPREDVAILLASSVIHLFPSLNDASAAVILESMASGSVPLVSKSGGNCEFFREGESGFSVAPGELEVDDFRRIIVDNLKRPDRLQRVSEAAIKTAQERTWAQVAEEYLTLLKIL